MEKGSLKIRVKFVRHEGHDIPLNSMLEASRNLLDFLSEVAKESGVSMDAHKWVASKFHSSNLHYDISYPDINEEQAENYRSNAERVVSTAYNRSGGADVINFQTRRKLLHIAEPLGTNDKVELGFYGKENGEKPIKVYSVAKTDAVREIKIINEADKIEYIPKGVVEYYGGIKGKATQWHKEGYVTFVIIKDLETNEDVKCYYKNEMYSQVHDLFEKKDSILLVSGKIRLDQDVQKIERVDMEKVAIDDSDKYYQDGDFEKFFGCAPGLTGGLSPREYIDKIRHGNE